MNTKNKSFSLIEVIVSIMILSFIILGVLALFNQFFKDETKYNQDYKFEKISEKIKNIIETKYLNFIITKKIIELETSIIGGSKPFNFKIDTYEVLYENNILLPIYDDVNLTKQEKQLKFWELSKKELEEFPLKPYDIYVTQNINSYKNILYPYKNIFLFKWNELSKMNGFNKSIKECLFSINTNKEISYVDYSNLSLITDSLGIPCNEIIDNFITNNHRKLENKIDSNNKETSYQSIKNEFKYLKIDNLNLIKNKMKLTLEKFDKVANNILDYSTREHKLLSNNDEISINNFISCYFDDTATTNENQCRISNFQNTEDINPNKIKFLFANGIWLYNEDTSTTPPTQIIKYNKDMNTTDLKNVIMTFKVDDNDFNKLISTNILTGTTADGITTFKEFQTYIDVNITGFVSLKMPPLLNGFKKNQRKIAGENDIVFLPETYKIFGLYDEIGNLTLGESEFMKIPFYFTNITGSRLIIKNTEVDIDKKFQINVPIIKNKGTEFETQNSGPFSAGMLLIFPWIVDTNETLFDNYNYGYYFKTLTSIK